MILVLKKIRGYLIAVLSWVDYLSVSLMLSFTIKKSIFTNVFDFKGKTVGTLHVLGNGPSLTDTISLIDKGRDIVIMVNFSPLTPAFFELQPKLLCWADPYLFSSSEASGNGDKVQALNEALRAVSWNLKLIVPSGARLCDIDLDNENIEVVFINGVNLHESIKRGRFWLYKKNLAAPAFQNVVNMALYCGIQLGYEKIILHGVDSDQYKSIAINDKNEMILVEGHYYGSKERNLAKERFHGFHAGTLYKRLDCEVKMFKSYIDISEYSKFLGIRVYNASENSMIDAFERCRKL